MLPVSIIYMYIMTLGDYVCGDTLLEYSYFITGTRVLITFQFNFYFTLIFLHHKYSIYIDQYIDRVLDL